MPRVEALMFCDAIQQTESKRMVAVGLSYELSPPVLPSAFTFACIAEVHDLPVNEEFTTQIKLVDPVGETVHEISGMNRIDINRPAFLGLELRNVLLKHEGPHTLQVVINGEVIGQRVIPVFVEKDGE